MSCVYAGLGALGDGVNSTDDLDPWLLTVVWLLPILHNRWIGGHRKHWACPMLSFAPRSATVPTRRWRWIFDHMPSAFPVDIVAFRPW
jgi:hypothetical protein